MTVYEPESPTNNSQFSFQSDLPATWVERKAQYATASRLISCLVNEHLVKFSAVPFEKLNLESSCFSSSLDPSLFYFSPPPSSSSSSSYDRNIRYWGKLTNPLISESNEEFILIPLCYSPISSRSFGSSEPLLSYLDPDDLTSNAVFWYFTSNPSSFNRNVNFNSSGLAKDELTQFDVSNGTIVSKLAANLTSLKLRRTLNPLVLWNIIGSWHGLLNSAEFQSISKELQSSVQVQEHFFKKEIQEPYFSSPAIVWEQAIIEGHPVHPMHRTRLFYSPLSFDYDYHFLENPLIVFLQVPKHELHTHGIWDSQIHPYLTRFIQSKCPDYSFESIDEEKRFVPVHILQWKYLQFRFPNRFTLVSNVSVPAVPQASTRTLVPLDSTFCFGYHFKLPLCVVITSALRTVSKYSIRNGPLLSQLASQLVDEKICRILNEVASIGLMDSDEHVAKLLGCILREPEPPNMYICAALFESTFTEARVHSLFQLTSNASKLVFLKQYVTCLFQAILPALFKGLAFEAHPQNMLVQVRKITTFSSSSSSSSSSSTTPIDSYEVIGFGVRDFGGVMLQPTLIRSFLPTSCLPLLDALDTGSKCLIQEAPQLYQLVYHTLITHHVHRLIRALQLHHHRSGWECVYEVLIEFLDNDKLSSVPLEFRKAWLECTTVKFKSFLKMKLANLYRDYVYDEVPNLLLLGSPLNSSLATIE